MSLYHQRPDEFNRLQVARLLQTSRAGRNAAIWVVVFLVIGIAVMFLPWRQTVRGIGKLTAFSPSDRPQTVNSTIEGKIAEWYVREGETVEEGDTILRITEIKDKFFDPQILKRMGQQLEAKTQAAEAYREKVIALSQQIEALQSGRVLSLEKAQNKLYQAKFKVSADSAGLEAAKLQVIVADTQFKRTVVLYDKGLKSLTDLETKRIKLQETQAKQNEATNKLLSSRNELINATIELSSLQAEYAEKIAKAASDRSSASAYLNDLEATIAKLRNEITNTEIRQGYYIVRAPRKGRLIKALKSGYGEMLKAGDPVITVVPENPEMAVELFVNANDLPLLAIGDQVRLQFDGWPALVFSGWEGPSFGTFGGKVSVIDYVATEKNKYRLLVTPDQTEEPWPDELRIGSGAIGWAMLNRVPVWYEIWRQMNGFPPTMYEPPGPGDKLPKAPKLGK